MDTCRLLTGPGRLMKLESLSPTTREGVTLSEDDPSLLGSFRGARALCFCRGETTIHHGVVHRWRGEAKKGGLADLTALLVHMIDASNTEYRSSSNTGDGTEQSRSAKPNCCKIDEFWRLSFLHGKKWLSECLYESLVDCRYGKENHREAILFRKHIVKCSVD